MKQANSKVGYMLDRLRKPMNARVRLILLALSGLLTGMTIILPVLGALEWIALVPAMAVLLDMARQQDNGERFSVRRTYGLGLLFYMCYYLVNFHWFMAVYPMEFMGVSPIAAFGILMFAWWGLSLFQALGAAFVFVAFMAISALPLVRKRQLMRVPLICTLWIILEWGQTLFWSGVPWARLCLGQTEAPVLLGTASWFGSYVISFGILLFNAAIAYALMYVGVKRVSAITCAGVLLFVVGGGAISTALTNNDIQKDAGKTFPVAAIQANFGSTDKWDVPTDEVFETHFSMTEQAAQMGAKLIVWPETAVPVTLPNKPQYMTRLTELADQYDATLLLGSFTVDAAGNKYNSVIAVQSDGSVEQQCYSKRHLVPFGEYIPLRPLVEAIVPGIVRFSASDLTPGADAAIYHGELGNIGSLICFDSIYEMLSIDSVRSGAQLLTLSTNDSWFSGSAAIGMHHAQSQLRAIETGRFVVRSAGTGQSGIISPTGEILAKQVVQTRGILYGEVELRDDLTLYCRIGNLFVWLCIAYTAALPMVQAILTIKQRKAC
jgi:apolipoprotein N-acyltransferase